MPDRWRQYAELANPDGWFWDTDCEHRFVWMSDSVERITGVPAAWHYGKARTDIRSATIDDVRWKNHLRALAEREPFEDFVFRRVGPDGVKWLSSSGVPFFDDAGAFGGYRGIGRDLTPQYLIAEQAEMLGAVIDDVDEMVVIWDGQD